MNIFVIGDNADPVLSAQNQLDKHIVKMPLETAQLLCSVYEPGTAPYRRTHYNHPCARWVRASSANFDWLVCHGRALCEEYTYRYGKVHASRSVIEWCDDNKHLLTFSDDRMTGMYQAMPEEYRNSDVVVAYRAYYLGAKREIATWKVRNPPGWWQIA